MSELQGFQTLPDSAVEASASHDDSDPETGPPKLCQCYRLIFKIWARFQFLKFDASNAEAESAPAHASLSHHDASEPQRRVRHFC